MLYGMKNVQNFLKERGYSTQLVNTEKRIPEPHTELLMLVGAGGTVVDVGVEDLSRDSEETQLYVVCEGVGRDYTEEPHVITYKQLYTREDDDYVTDIRVVTKHMLIFNGFPQSSDELARDFINHMLGCLS